MWKTSAKLSVGKPSVGSHDIAVKVAVDLPASLFLRPSLEAKISVPDHAVTPLQIDMEVIDNIQELIHAQTGFEVRLVQDGKEGS